MNKKISPEIEVLLAISNSSSILPQLVLLLLKEKLLGHLLTCTTTFELSVPSSGSVTSLHKIFMETFLKNIET